VLPTPDVENVCQPFGNPENCARIMKCKNNSFESLAFTFVSFGLFFSQITKTASSRHGSGRGEAFFQVHFQTFFVDGASAKFEQKKQLGSS